MYIWVIWHELSAIQERKSPPYVFNWSQYADYTSIWINTQLVEEVAERMLQRGRPEAGTGLRPQREAETGRCAVPRGKQKLVCCDG